VRLFLNISHSDLLFFQVFQVEKVDTGAVYAMKVIRKDVVIKSHAVENTIAEREILRKIRHPFLISLHYAFQTEDKLYLVMDFANGGQLFDHLVSLVLYCFCSRFNSPIPDMMRGSSRFREEKRSFSKITPAYIWQNSS
jgi:serine/threonine protein kinase